MTPQPDTTSIRLTVRLPADLYSRLTLFAQGRSNGRTPELSHIVREALEQYLTPAQRQTPRQTRARGNVTPR